MRLYKLYSLLALYIGLLMGAGDIAAQHFVEHKTWDSHDIWRTIRLTSTGLFIIGPIFHVWYDMFLSKLFLQRTMKIALKKVVLDQGLFAPVFLVLFYCSLGMLELSPAKKTVARLKSEFLPNMAVNYSIWPAVQFVNFYFIQQPKYNILFVNVASIFWNSFLSWAAHKDVHAKFSHDSCHDTAHIVHDLLNDDSDMDVD
ncbi:Mpv17 isoform X2 [Paramuricea clavata]|uniref:Mitochondrial inner membrane protein Mpv17 n=1 Tax=Paramuricea clavata TaxID=317549 RepID=A0A6S7I819_PARCT|nr:Mpv17 isoform X2 [Paramuricea clavata]